MTIAVFQQAVEAHRLDQIRAAATPVCCSKWLPWSLRMVVSCAMLLTVSVAAARPSPELVKDIRPSLLSDSSNPRSFVTSGTMTYFIASTASTGAELWKTDGSAQGTTIVKDICAGATGSSISRMTFLHNTLLFIAQSNATIGPELWKSDGTDAGTLMVKDINPNAFSGSSIDSNVAVPATSLTVFQNKVYFSASDGTNGAELWSSDGTDPGTTIVANINSGSASAFSSSHIIVTAGSYLYFSATNGSTSGKNGNELWVFDGTNAPSLVDINTGTGSSSPANGVELNGNLLFSATGATGQGGNELYIANGTSVSRVKDINPGGNSSPSQLTAAGNTIFFRANDGAVGTELWKTDGTDVGTTLVKDIYQNGTASSSLSDLTKVGSQLFFTADGNNGSASSAELWKSDGTDAGTTLVKDLNPDDLNSSDIGPIFDIAGTAFFRAFTGTYGTEIWKSDGTDEGTTIVADLMTGPTDGVPGSSVSGIFWGVRGAQLIFAGTDSHGTELWVADDQNGASFIKDLSGGGDSDITFTHGLNGNLYFSASNGTNGQEPWFSNNSTAGTYLLKDVSTSGDSSPAEFRDVNGVVVFTAQDSTYGYELYSSDGTPGGTNLLVDINPSSVASTPLPLGVIGNTLLMSATKTAVGSNTGRELWKTNGTALGTTIVRDINPGPANSDPRRFAILNGAAIFTADNGINGYELWRTDGTAAGTWLVKDIWTGSTASNPDNLVTLGESVYFTATDASHGTELWKTNGTAAGTVLLTDIVPGTSSSSPASLVELNGYLYFVATDAAHGTEIWISDGTSAGTTLLEDVQPGSVGSNPHSLTAVNGSLYFVASDSSHGAELWRTDGPTGPTELVRDIQPGSGSSDPQGLEAAESALAFTADDGVHGRELWATDGSSAGTFLVSDIALGANSSSPDNLEFTSNTLYFSADDHTTAGIGNELWSAPLAALDATSPTVTKVTQLGAAMIEITFSEPASATASAASSYIITGTGTGTLSASPNSISRPNTRTARLRWNSGAAGDGTITVTVLAAVTDLAGNTMGTPDSGTFTSTAISAQPLAAAVVSSSTMVASLSGILVEDATGDQNPELVALDSTIGAGSIYFGSGNAGWSFGSPITSGGGSPTAAAFAFYNYNGSPDLLIANQTSNTVSRHGLFGGIVGDPIPVGTAPRAVAAGDFDNDGIDDFVTADSGSNTVSFAKVTHPQSFSTVFAPAVAYSVGQTPSALAKGDFNRDGKLDVACVNSGSNTVSVLLGGASAGFGSTLTFSVGDQPSAITTADVNADGRTDLLIANHASGDITVLLGSATGLFTKGVEVLATGATAVACADMNRDGKLDLIVASDAAPLLHLYAGTGAGTFLPAYEVALPYPANFVAAADIDRDGDPDIAAGNSTAGNVALVQNHTIHKSALFAAPGALTAAPANLAFAVAGDLNRDGKPDMLLADFTAATIQVLLGNNSATLTTASTINLASAPSHLQLADIDDDGILDLVLTAAASPFVIIQLGDGQGGFSSSLTPNPAFLSVPPAIADFNQDGHLDMVGITGTPSQYYASLWYGDGTGAFADSGNIFEVPAAQQLIAADFYRGNSAPDLALLCRDTATLNLYFGDQQYPIQPFPSQVTLPAVSSGMSLCELTHDDVPDLLISSSTAGQVFALTSNGFGFNTPITVTPGGQPTHATAADLNDDGFSDLLIPDTSGTSVTVSLGKSDGSFSAPVNYPTAGGAAALVAADLDRDGQTDLLSADTAALQVSALQNQGGQFGFDTLAVGPAGGLASGPTAILKITAFHRGLLTDLAVRLQSLHLGFADASGTTLTTAQANALLASLEIRVDSNSNNQLDAGDAILTNLASLSLDADGRQQIALPQVAATQIPAAGSKTYWVVVTGRPGASELTPNTMRIRHVTSASSKATEPTTGRFLQMEFTPDVTSDPAVLPVSASAFILE